MVKKVIPFLILILISAKGLTQIVETPDPCIAGAVRYYRDMDGDGVGNSEDSLCICDGSVPDCIGLTTPGGDPPVGYVAQGGDCDDNNSSVQYISFWFPDDDNDGYGSRNTTLMVSSCHPPLGFVSNKLDCDDTDPNITIISNVYYSDADGDGFGNPLVILFNQCTPPEGYVTNGDDLCPNEYGIYSGCTNELMNWITSKSYDIEGQLIASGKVYYDELGKSIQAQSVDIKTGNTWASSTLYDTQGRTALQTLSAPIDTQEVDFIYTPHFVKKTNGNTYASEDFETDIENPEPIGNQEGSLGWYYSNANSNEAYQDITDYPFARTIYSQLNPGSALRTIGGNKINGEWKNGYAFSMKAGQELTQSVAFNDPNYDTNTDTRKIIKTVARDVHGVENVAFTDTDGKTLAAARSGGNTLRNSTISIGEQGFVDVHIPVDATGFSVNSSDITVYDLITEQPVTSATTGLANGFYRVAINDLDTYVPHAVTVTYQENYYDYSLSYYDDIGRLSSSKQPLNQLETTYTYNAEGELTSTTSPDEGTANFNYRSDGQIRFSQNEKQVAAGEFSYTNYDSYGRPVESGVFNEGSISFANSDTLLDAVLNDITIDNDGLPNASCNEQHFTKYDKLNSGELAALPGLDVAYHQSSFLSGNVAKTINDQTTTYYSYDIYGRVAWIVQDITDLGIKTIDYNYNPITGLVTEVDYQHYDPNERFIHRYTYDVDDYSLIKVETSTDALVYILHAQYNYYETGQLKNVILADGIQQTDYVYNLAGQLKAINHPNLSTIDDPGANANDLFGMSIAYHNNDYLRSNNFNTVVGGTDQYNGNIKGIAWNIDYSLGNNPVQYTYEYNRNNWLTEAKFNGNGNASGSVPADVEIDTPVDPNQTVQATNSITFLPGAEVDPTTNSIFTAEIAPPTTGGTYEDDDYKVYDITYDANGNIQTLNRNKNTENDSNAMDALSYHYYTNKPNQLKRVDDAITIDTNANDIKDQDGDSNGENYKYNAIGQLVENIDEDIAYVYNASGLVTEVNKLSGAPIVKFYYNDKNHRLKKEGYNPNTSILMSTTYYVRDVAGTPLAIYTQNLGQPLELAEHTIYGASRLGVHYRQSDTDTYQLTDHLGNVRAVIVKTGDNAAAITAKTDYYPFGMPMPNRNVEGNYRYAFQGQEKDPETGMEAFELRLWDSRIGRWLTTDPYGQYASPYLGMGNNPISRIDPDGGYSPPTDYINKQTGATAHVDDGINQTVEIDNSLWSYVLHLSNNGITSIYSDVMNQILLTNSTFLSNTSVAFSNADLASAQSYQKRNNGRGSSRHDCLTTVCGATRRVFSGEDLNLGAAMTMNLAGNADGNNMNKTMQHLINIGKASGSQLTFNKTTGSYGNIGQQLSGKTPLNSTSVFGLSLSNAYHSLMVYVERTSTHTKYHLVDQFTFQTFNNSASFNTAVDNHFHGPYSNHRTIFTQYQH